MCIGQYGLQIFLYHSIDFYIIDFNCVVYSLLYGRLFPPIRAWRFTGWHTHNIVTLGDSGPHSFLVLSSA